MRFVEPISWNNRINGFFGLIEGFFKGKTIHLKAWYSPSQAILICKSQFSRFRLSNKHQVIERYYVSRTFFSAAFFLGLLHVSLPNGARERCSRITPLLAAIKMQWSKLGTYSLASLSVLDSFKVFSGNAKPASRVFVRPRYRTHTWSRMHPGWPNGFQPITNDGPFQSVALRLSRKRRLADLMNRVIQFGNKYTGLLAFLQDKTVFNRPNGDPSRGIIRDKSLNA